MKKIAAVFFLFFLSIRAAQAGEIGIYGKTLETGTKKPLGGITVYVTENEDLATVSDPDGTFFIPMELPGTYTVIGVGMGFQRSQPVKAEATPESDKKPAEIFLEPAQTLSEVVVQAERNADKTSKVVITEKELAAVPGTGGDPLRGIQAIPGITTASDQSANPAIRGSGPNDNLYYVDFLPVYYLFHMGGLESDINPAVVDDFNLYLSAFGPEFGDVTGGVLDVKLRDPRSDRFATSLGMSLLEADALVEGPVGEKGSFFVGARRSYIDLFLPSTGDFGNGARYRQFPQFYDYQGKFLWKPSEDNQVSFQFSGAQDSMVINVPATSDIAKQQPVLAGDISNGMGYDMAGIVLSSRLSANASNKLGFSYSLNNLNQNVAQMGHATVNSRDFFARDMLDLNLFENHEFIFEAENDNFAGDVNLALTSNLPSDFSPPPDWSAGSQIADIETIVATGYGFGAKDRYKATEDLTLVGGVRSTYGNYNGKFVTEPRFSAEYRLNPKALLTAGWGKYHEFPYGWEVLKNLGNPSLDNTKADHYVAGVEQQVSDEISMKTELYYKKFYDLVVPYAPTNYTNGGSGDAYGGELLIKKKKTGNWNGWISVARTVTERKNDITGLNFPYSSDQPLVVNMVYSWRFSEKWTFGARWRYQSGQPYTPVLGANFDAASQRWIPVYGAVDSARLPDYHRLDLMFDREYVFNTWKMAFSIEFINAYGHENVSGYNYNSDYTSAKPIGELPFIPSVGIRAEF